MQVFASIYTSPAKTLGGKEERATRKSGLIIRCFDVARERSIKVLKHSAYVPFASHRPDWKTSGGAHSGPT